MCHAVFCHAVIHDPSTCAFDTTLHLKSFCLLGPCIKLPVLPTDFLHPSPDPHFKGFQCTSSCLHHHRHHHQDALHSAIAFCLYDFLPELSVFCQLENVCCRNTGVFADLLDPDGVEPSMWTSSVCLYIV